jgi:hypothetical protein
MRVLAVSVLVFLAALFAALPAEATAPGDNGRIAFRRFVGPDAVATLFTTRPDGTGERQLAQPPDGAGDDHPDYAADGSLVAFDRCGDIGLQTVGTSPSRTTSAASSTTRSTTSASTRRGSTATGCGR